MIARRIRSGDWEKKLRGIYLVNGSPDSVQQRTLAGLLALPGSVASHRTAARLWGLDGVKGSEVDLITNHHWRNFPGINLHSTPFLPKAHITRRGILTLTNPSRTLLDLGAVASEATVEIALDSALRQEWTAIPVLIRLLDEMGVKGRSGAGVLRALVRNRTAGVRPHGSVFETRLARALRKAGLGHFVPQYKIEHFGQTFFIDFAFPKEKVAIEAEGLAHHSGRQALEKDSQRSNILVSMGWRVVRVTWGGLTRDREGTIDQIRNLLLTRTSYRSEVASPR